MTRRAPVQPQHQHNPWQGAYCAARAMRRLYGVRAFVVVDAADAHRVAEYTGPRDVRSLAGARPTSFSRKGLEHGIALGRGQFGRVRVRSLTRWLKQLRDEAAIQSKEISA